METLFSVIKYLSTLVTAIGGFIGIVSEYRTEQGKLARGGRIALSLILAGLLFSVTSQALQNHFKKAGEIRRSNEQKAILEEIQRGLFPLDSISLLLDVRFPIKEISPEEIKEYHQLIDNELKKVSKGELEVSEKIPFIRRDENGLMAIINRVSPIFPKDISSLFFSGIIIYQLSFYTDTQSGIDNQKPDLTYKFVDEDKRLIESSIEEIQYLSHRREFRIVLQVNALTPFYSSDKIIGMYDLENTILKIFSSGVTSYISDIMIENSKGMRIRINSSGYEYLDADQSYIVINLGKISLTR